MWILYLLNRLIIKVNINIDIGDYLNILVKTPKIIILLHKNYKFY